MQSEAKPVNNMKQWQEPFASDKVINYIVGLVLVCV